MNIIPVRQNDPAGNCYYFVYTGHFKNSGGVYVYTNDSDDSKLLETTFRLNVYTSSSEETPIPIYEYKDLLSMKDNGHYILLCDIEMPTDNTGNYEAFTPFVGNFKSLDGNAHTITFAGTYNVGELSEIGLFSSLKENSIIKNLNVCYSNGVKFTTSASTFNFAGLVTENRGIISNCYVYTEGYSSDITIEAKNSPLNAENNFAGLVVDNSGFITNSRTSVKTTTSFNASGFVANNSGKIAASIVKNLNISHNSDYVSHVAGFVIKNSEAGQIITSYISGSGRSNNLISSGSSISSTSATAGFAYENTGTIRDCYSDVNMTSATSYASGFVYANGGNVKNCFSLSHLQNNVDNSTGFARLDEVENTKGTFENCYYYSNSASSINSSINIPALEVSGDGVTKLDDSGFAKLSENFAGYSYTKNISTNAVWFYNKEGSDSSQDFVEFPRGEEKITTVNDKEQHTYDYSVSQPMSFASGRLELVSPNIYALSARNLYEVDKDDETDDVVYRYIDESTAPNRGTLHNPILLSTAEDFESDLTERASSSKVNKNSYRIISDIDYSDYDALSQTHKITFAGNMEGNGMTISRIAMESMEKLSNAGLFGQIGMSANNKGFVKNLYISPGEVTFSTTTNVGTLAGTLKYGYLYDIRVEATGDNLIIDGLNFVGGIVGKAVSDYVIQDAYSNVNVTSYYLQPNNSNYEETISNEASQSYAGSIAGFVGKGKVYNVSSEDVTSVMGGHAGVLFGGIGKDCEVTYAYAKISDQLKIKAYYYGGFISGEITGNVKNVYVDGNNLSEFKPFVVVPKVALAVGGITGILSGGTIENAYMNQSLTLENSSQDNYIAFAGGIAGLVYSSKNEKSKINQAVVESNICARSILGGAVGGVNSYLEIDSVAIRSQKLKLEGKKADPYLGGIIGGIGISNITGVSAGNGELIMNNCYCLADLELNTNTPGLASTAKVGGLIGGDENRFVKLSYCYTTSQINATVYNSRSLYSPTDNGVTNETIPNADTNNNTNDNIENVYFFGANSSDQAIIRNFVTGKTTEGNSWKVIVNNYGDGSYNFAGDSLKTSKSALYNLFAKDFKIKINDKVETFEFNTARDQFTWDGEGPFEKDPNNDDIYRRGILYNDSDDNFFKADVDGLTYVYVGTEEQTGQTTSSYPNTKFVVDKNGSSILRSENGHEYSISSISGGMIEGIGSDTNWKINLSTFIRYEQIHKSQLLQVIRYKAPNGDIYEQDMDDSDGKFVLKNLSNTAEFYEFNKDGNDNTPYDSQINKMFEQLNLKIAELGLKPIWKLNMNGFTTLAFESSILDWTKKV